MCKCCISDMGKDARAGCFDAYFFHHPVCWTVYAGGKESGLMVTILGERRAVPVMPSPDRRTVPSSAVWTYDSSLA